MINIIETLYSLCIQLGPVHNCQHLCIRTERTEEGRGHDASVLFLNVDLLLMLPPGGYD